MDRSIWMKYVLGYHSKLFSGPEDHLGAPGMGYLGELAERYPQDSTPQDVPDAGISPGPGYLGEGYIPSLVLKNLIH